MRVDQRPKGLATTAILMSITNAIGWLIIDSSKPHVGLLFVAITITIAIGYVVIWFYWKGKNWARILVLLTCLLSLFNLLQWNRIGFAERVMVGSEAVLAIFLLYWLNTPGVKDFFRSERTAAA